MEELLLTQADARYMGHTHLIVSSADSDWGHGELVLIPLDKFMRLGLGDDGQSLEVKFKYNVDSEETTEIIPIFNFVFLKIKED